MGIKPKLCTYSVKSRDSTEIEKQNSEFFSKTNAIIRKIPNHNFYNYVIYDDAFFKGFLDLGVQNLGLNSVVQSKTDY